MLTRSRLVRVALATAATLAIGAPAAGAACPDRPFSKVFSAWNDSALYTLAPNGDFEAGAAGWTLKGNARLVAENPLMIDAQAGDTTSLELPPGSSATSPPICVSSGYPTTRMFGNTLVASPDSGSTLQVEVLYIDATRGGQSVKKLGTTPDEPAWDATRKMSLAQGQLNIKPDSGGNTYVHYRFTPLYKTTWRIDDFYVDPRLRG